MTESIENKLQSWLSTSGFPLEMRVAAALHATGLDVRQGEYYTDPREPGKRREIDVVASTRAAAAYNALVEIAVECKLSAERPWVVLSRSWPRGLDGWPGAAAQMSDTARAVRYGSANLIPAGPRVGYAVRPAFKKSDDYDSAYGAILQAVSYGEYVTGSSFRLPGGQRPRRRVVLPCVVFEGDLFEAFLSPDGAVDVRPIQQAALECRHAASPNGFVAGVIVSAMHFDEFAQLAAAWAKDVAARLAHNP